MVTTFISITDAFTVDEIEALLLAQEHKLEKKLQLQILDNPKTGAGSTVVANMAQTRNGGGRTYNMPFSNNRGRGQCNSSGRNGRRGSRPWQNYQGYQPNQNFQTFQGSTKQQATCQLCGKNGHIVWNCYHKFDYNFHPFQFSNQATNNNSKP